MTAPPNIITLALLSLALVLLVLARAALANSRCGWGNRVALFYAGAGAACATAALLAWVL